MQGTVPKCELRIKNLLKTLERIEDAEQAYTDGNIAAAIARAGGAFTSLALAYAKGEITKDEWKELSRTLYGVREAILRGDPLKDVIDRIEKASDILRRYALEKFEKCMRGELR